MRNTEVSVVLRAGDLGSTRPDVAFKFRAAANPRVCGWYGAHHLEGVGDVELALPLVDLFVVRARLQSQRVLRAVEVRDDDPNAQRAQAHHERLRAAPQREGT